MKGRKNIQNENTEYICDLFPHVIFKREILTWMFTFPFMHLADAFIQSDLQCIQAIHLFVSMCVPWESNPQPLRC